MRRRDAGRRTPPLSLSARAFELKAIFPLKLEAAFGLDALLKQMLQSANIRALREPFTPGRPLLFLKLYMRMVE
jgi:hypothetical protein